jgi:redox-sensing transcriptional repressor
MAMVKRNIKRLLQYKLCLVRFQELGFETIYSYNLGEAAGVNAAQVRKDFSEFGIRGNKKGGYNIDYLIETLNRLFGDDKKKTVIIVGMGNIGRALAQYNPRFSKKNLFIVAGFDIDPAKQKKSYGIQVYPVEKLKEIIDQYDVSTAILSVPVQTAQEMCNTLINAGIKGILNFSPVILKIPEEIIINNINLSNEIESIIFNIR